MKLPKEDNLTWWESSMRWTMAAIGAAIGANSDSYAPAAVFTVFTLICFYLFVRHEAKNERA